MSGDGADLMDPSRGPKGLVLLWAELAALSAGCLLFLGVNFLPKDLLFENSDFEQGDLTNWIAEDPAFVLQPTYGDNTYYRGMGASGLVGNFWVGSFENRPHPYRPPGQAQGDWPQGRLLSEEFKIKGDRISFLLGGGDGSDSAGVGLLIDGKQQLFTAGSGRLVKTERMKRIVWDVSAWKGRLARIVIVDKLSGPWGHVNADDFRWER